MLELDHLTVSGYVTFGKQVSLKVKIVSRFTVSKVGYICVIL